MHARTLELAAILSVLLPQALPAQTTERLREYARGVQEAERGIGNRWLGVWVDTSTPPTSWPRALAKLEPPPGYERLHATLVRNARLIASAATRAPVVEPDCTRVVGTVTENCPAASTPAPEGRDQRLHAAMNAYRDARARLAERLRSAGVSPR